MPGTQINYGKGQIISEVELLVNSTDECDNGKSLVFIPKETSVELGGYEVQKIMAPMAASYPVRYAGKKKYVFVLGRLDNISKTYSIDWKSCRAYSTATEAMQQFQFLLIMLKYPGNFYVEPGSDNCKFRVYIREVLAISAHGFASPKEAWEKEGIEKFICVSQSEHGFHNYINRVTCNPGFYVACNNTGLRHPCAYDTPSRRDQVMDQLYQASDFNFMDLVQKVDQEQIILTDLKKNPLAIIHTGGKRSLDYNPCEWLLLFMESVYNEKNYVKKGGHFSLNYRYTKKDEKQERFFKIAEPAPASASMSFRAWKLELQKIACYFPVRRLKDISSSDGSDQYKVEIKLPRFDACCRDMLCDDPCSSTISKQDCTPSCYLSWISDCCFDDCCQALDFYLSSLILLKRYDYYKPVYDCNCGSYRIELHPQLTLKERAEYLRESGDSFMNNPVCSGILKERSGTVNKKLDQLQNKISCFSEIIAFSPQFYSNPEMACNAVDRSKKLINSEGLHLVEHILLRPRCKDEKGNYAECDCDALPRPCLENDINCHFQWKPGGEVDPCESVKKVCLIPGYDPYSFIATLVIPAWPERFRSESGRKILEKLLQREAPAHVLLRILWLRPRDLCCFEFYDKRWLEWLSHKLCDPGYNNCDFLNLLFKKEFQSLPECRDCIPCYRGSEELKSCTPPAKDPCAGIDVLSNINELFCWSEDKEFNFRYCESGMSARFFEKRSEGNLKKTDTGKKTSPLVEEEKNKVEKDLQATIAKDQSLKDKFRLVQSRAHRYEIQMNILNEAFPGKEIVAHALIFLKKSKPSSEQFIALAESILKDKTNRAKNIRGLNRSQKQVAIQNITWKYLDSICFNGKDMDKILALKDSFKLLKEKGVDMKALYQGWESEKLAGFEPGIDYKKIKKLILGQ